MGKKYEAVIEDFTIVDGVITNCVIADNFTSQNDTTKDIRELKHVTFTLDGITLEEAIQLLWKQIKVVAQARSWKHMSDKEFLALDGEVHDILPFIAKAERTSSKTAILNKAKTEQMKKFYDKALEKALDELGAEAKTEDLTAWATEYYNNEYKEIVESM